MAEQFAGRSGSLSDKKKFILAIVGQPNSGKTTIFNFLTGLKQHVGNWPGKTVASHEGSISINGEEILIVDIPGLYSITSTSEEERIAEEFILSTRPDLLLVVGNAACLERSLFFLQEVALLEMPVIFLLNMMDVATRNGIEINVPSLSHELGIPIVPIVARTGKNIADIKKIIADCIAKPQERLLKNLITDQGFYEINSKLATALPEDIPSQWVVYKLVQNSKQAKNIIKDYCSPQHHEDLAASVSPGVSDSLRIISSIYENIGEVIKRCVVHQPTKTAFITDKIDRLSTHHIWGIVILIVLFSIIFSGTFYLAAPLQELLDHDMIIPFRAFIKSTLGRDYPFVSHLIADGLIAGVGMVLTFLPVLMFFYIALALAEDTGYLARVAYIMDRFMQKIGLHGKTALPLFMAFGCNVPAVLGARVIESQIAKMITIFLAPLVPCTARLTVIFYIAPIFFGAWAPIVAIGLVALNIAIIVIIGFMLGRLFFKHGRVSFLMELPDYHLPSARTIITFTSQHLWQFLKNAATIILLFSVVIWFLSNYPGDTIEDSYLSYFGRKIEPAAKVMGFDWRMIIALFTSFLSKENAIATLGILYSQNGEGSITTAIREAISPLSALSFLVVSMLFIPCVATVGVVRQESKSWFWTIINMLVITLIAFGAGVLTYQCGSFFGYGN